MKVNRSIVFWGFSMGQVKRSTEKEKWTGKRQKKEKKKEKKKKSKERGDR
jgi:hypothetical protein